MPTIALFGATGGTGSEFLKVALDAGHTVRALARTPSKMKMESERLTVVQGTFADADKVLEVVTGADYVVSMGGSVSNPVPDTMINFVKMLHPIMQDAGTKVFFYQSGAACKAPAEARIATKFRLMRLTVARAVGLEALLKDHEHVMEFMNENMKGDVKFIVSRPGGGGLQPGESKKKLQVVDSASLTQTRNVDLATWSLEALEDESLYGKYPFVE